MATLTEDRAATAISHPLRRTILDTMITAKGTKLSPVHLAEVLDEKLPNVSYHVRVLLKLGAIKPAGRRQVRGAVEHYYLPVAKITMRIEPINQKGSSNAGHK